MDDKAEGRRFLTDPRSIGPDLLHNARCLVSVLDFFCNFHDILKCSRELEETWKEKLDGKEYVAKKKKKKDLNGTRDKKEDLIKFKKNTEPNLDVILEEDLKQLPKKKTIQFWILEYQEYMEAMEKNWVYEPSPQTQLIWFSHMIRPELYHKDWPRPMNCNPVMCTKNPWLARAYLMRRFTKKLFASGYVWPTEKNTLSNWRKNNLSIEPSHVLTDLKWMIQLRYIARAILNETRLNNQELISDENEDPEISLICSTEFLMAQRCGYLKYLTIIQQNQHLFDLISAPHIGIDLMWHAHMLSPESYKKETSFFNSGTHFLAHRPLADYCGSRNPPTKMNLLTLWQQNFGTPSSMYDTLSPVWFGRDSQPQDLLSALPVDIITEIFALLTTKELWEIGLVCSEWRSFTLNRNDLWKGRAIDGVYVQSREECCFPIQSIQARKTTTESAHFERFSRLVNERRKKRKEAIMLPLLIPAALVLVPAALVLVPAALVLRLFRKDEGCYKTTVQRNG
eukprot:TRINITY_DN2367_c0_g1_i2.p1 TRINITY_DN2367_c0_g1~~TRINITY_DN2367_c0_g1_i2.p1  ORF type:complete len:510 (+),score=59.38 TRINITY_DN2367_c0_g1_i2:30-1559(+)